MLVGCCLLLLSACATAPAPEPTAPVVHGSCTLATTDQQDETAIRALLAAEGEYVVQQAIQPLMQLWNSGASIVDAKNTPTNADDDQQWLDKDAIRHRYVRIVFPGAPAVASPKDLIIAIEDARAVVTATTQIGTEVSPAGDRWQLSKTGGCWGIDNLTYNLEAHGAEQ